VNFWKSTITRIKSVLSERFYNRLWSITSSW